MVGCAESAAPSTALSSPTVRLTRIAAAQARRMQLGYAEKQMPRTVDGRLGPRELFSRLGREAPAPALFEAIRVGWTKTRRTTTVAFANVQNEDVQLHTARGGGCGIHPPVFLVCSSLSPAQNSR